MSLKHTSEINNFEPLKQKILTEGTCLEGGILKVDGFINHQIDTNLLKSMATEILRRFNFEKIDKVLTIEAGGIPLAVMIAFLLDVRCVFIKKAKPSTMSDCYTSEVYSFTKQKKYEVCANKSFIKEGENILFVDDFLANGQAAQGVMDIIEQAHANLVGMGFIIEKSFQSGGKMIRDRGIKVVSLATIESLDNCTIKFKE